MRIVVKGTDYIIDCQNSLELPLKQDRKIVKVFAKQQFVTMKDKDRIAVLREYENVELAKIAINKMQEAFKRGDKDYVL